MIKVIGLVGKKSSGKDSVCNEMLRLSAQYLTKYPVYRIAFADALKEEVADLFRTAKVNVEASKNHPTVRNALQFHGSYKRGIIENYWLDKVKDKIIQYLERKQCKDKGCILVITDVRHLNEADYIKSIGGILIRITRDETDKVEDNHETETNIDKIKIDNRICNDYSLERLAKLTEDILKQYNLLT